MFHCVVKSLRGKTQRSGKGSLDSWLSDNGRSSVISARSATLVSQACRTRSLVKSLVFAELSLPIATVGCPRGDPVHVNFGLHAQYRLIAVVFCHFAKFHKLSQWTTSGVAGS